MQAHCSRRLSPESAPGSSGSGRPFPVSPARCHPPPISSASPTLFFPQRLALRLGSGMDAACQHHSVSDSPRFTRRLESVCARHAPGEWQAQPCPTRGRAGASGGARGKASCTGSPWGGGARRAAGGAGGHRRPRSRTPRCTVLIKPLDPGLSFDCLLPSVPGIPTSSATCHVSLGTRVLGAISRTLQDGVCSTSSQDRERLL